MPRQCALGCPPLGVPTHMFPNPEKFPERFKAWVEIVGGKLETSDDYVCYRKKKICDIHFIDGHKNRNHRLNALAVPTLCLPNGTVTVASAPHLDDAPQHPHLTSIQNLTGKNTTTTKQKARFTEAVPNQVNNLEVRPTKGSNLEAVPTTDNNYGAVPGDNVMDTDHDDIMMYDDEDMDDLFSINAVKKVEKVPEKRNEAIREGYSCNVCQDHISGFRYTCVQCRDFDLCSACEAKGEHSSHYVLRIPECRLHEDIDEVLRSIRRRLFGEKRPSSRNTSPIENFDPVLDDRIQEEPSLYPMASVNHFIESQEQHRLNVQIQDIRSEKQKNPTTILNYNNNTKKSLTDIKKNTLTEEKENFKLDIEMTNITLHRKCCENLSFQSDPLFTTDDGEDVILQDGSRNDNENLGVLKLSSRWPSNSTTKVVNKESNQEIATPKIIICKSRSIRNVKFKKRKTNILFYFNIVYLSL